MTVTNRKQKKQYETGKSGRYAITDEFPIRPSWCEAALCLIQIKREKASGNKPALILRRWLQTGLFYMGWIIQKHFASVLIFGLAIFLLLGAGLRQITIETNIEKLWVPKGGRLDGERAFTKGVSRQKSIANDWLVMEKGGINDDTAVNFQVLIQTVKHKGENILRRDQLQMHVNLLHTLAQINVTEFNRTWSLSDICFKAEMPQPKHKELSVIGEVRKALLPCVTLSPLDCFWDGSIPLGPFSPEAKKFLGSKIHWKVLHPMNLLSKIHEMFRDMLGDEVDAEVDLFTRSAISSGYLERPCIDPLDPECPKSAPNHVDLCSLTMQFTKWNKDHGSLYSLPAIPTSFEPINTSTQEPPVQKQGLESLGVVPDETINITEIENLPPECRHTPYVEKVREILRANETLAQQFVPGIYANYGKALTGGCTGFATRFMEWPEKLIIGDIKRDSNNDIISAGALQSVVLIATHNDIFERFKDKFAKNNSDGWWNSKAALKIIKSWQRKYSRMIYDWPNNTGESRILHPLAAASLEDMIEEFSQFNPMFIIVGYILMVIYACFSAMSFANKCVRSNLTLALTGCGIVLLANISGLGCTLFLGIDFNATTTQILPFLLLSLGVDEMFLLLNKYSEIVTKVNHHEIAILLRETGLSVLITYVNNILAFFAGVMLPIPALKIFCVQVAIVLVFNLIAILTLFPAVMALDLKRQRSGRVDLFCCFKGEPVKAGTCVNYDTVDHVTSISYEYNSGDSTTNSSVVKKVKNDNDALKSSGKSVESGIPDEKMADIGGGMDCTLTNFVRNYYAPLIQKVPMKILILLVFIGIMAVSVYGLFFVPIGLELSEIVPKGTAPHSFFKAREKYFPFYPIYTVIKGPDLDYASKAHQKLMRDFTDDIRKVSFVVKTETKNDWFSLMNEWLTHAQKAFDEDWNNGLFNATLPEGKEPSYRGKVAKKLICAQHKGEKCQERLGKVRLIDSDGFINPDDYYYYLTAWYNLDHLTYIVTEANFYPPPPTYDFEDETIEPAPKLIFSQFPFFVNDINNTARILDMISAIRDVCEKYNDQGLTVFPQGVPFTFWELYLHLAKSLIIAFGIITAAVFIAISIMLFNPWISCLIVIVLILMIVVELGFMGIINIKLNPISAVTLITAVGIRVKFTVHVALSFLTTVGSRNERIVRTLEHMFIPVLHGGLSTLIGLLMLAFSKFEFIFEYYFMIMFALVILGILSGLILMPVILSWFGPPPEVESADGASFLMPPDNYADSFDDKDPNYKLHEKMTSF